MSLPHQNASALSTAQRPLPSIVTPPRDTVLMPNAEQEARTTYVQYVVIGEITPTDRNYKAACGIAGCTWKAYKHSHMHAERALAVHSAMTHARGVRG